MWNCFDNNKAGCRYFMYSTQYAKKQAGGMVRRNVRSQWYVSHVVDTTTTKKFRTIVVGGIFTMTMFDNVPRQAHGGVCWNLIMNDKMMTMMIMMMMMNNDDDTVGAIQNIETKEMRSFTTTTVFTP